MEDFLAEAQSQEERGERYQWGQKSKRAYEAAVEAYRKALQLEDISDVRFNLARLLLLLSDFDYQTNTKISMLEEALQLLNCDSLDSCFNLGQVVTALIDLNPSFMQYFTLAQDAFEKVLQNQISESDFEGMVETLVAFSTLYLNAASHQDFSAAVELFQVALTKLQSCSRFYSNVEPIDITLARVSVLVSHADSLLESNKNSNWQQLYQEAESLLTLAIENFPSNAEALSDKADLMVSWCEGLLLMYVGGTDTCAFKRLLSLASKPQDLTNVDVTPASLVTHLKNMYASAAKLYSEAHVLDEQKAAICWQMGNVEFTRTFLYSDGNRSILLGNAECYYKRALSILGIHANLLSAPKECKDEEAAKGVLYGLGRVVSHVAGREEEARIYLKCWQRRGGRMEAGDAFGAGVAAEDWFKKL